MVALLFAACDAADTGADAAAPPNDGHAETCLGAECDGTGSEVDAQPETDGARVDDTFHGTDSWGAEVVCLSKLIESGEYVNAGGEGTIHVDRASGTVTWTFKRDAKSYVATYAIVGSHVD